MAWHQKPPLVNDREKWVYDAPTRFETRRVNRGAPASERYTVTSHASLADALAAARADRSAALYAVRATESEERFACMSPEWCAVAPNGTLIYPTAQRQTGEQT